MSRKQKVHSLTGRITYKRMVQAFQAVKRNRGAAGIDKVSIQMFEANLQDNLEALMRVLKTRSTFSPYPLRRRYIPKEPGKFRPLGIPAVRDRVAQEVVRTLLTPVFEPQFYEDSYGFRPERNCHLAVERLLELHAQGYTHVLDADIQGFFDNIPHHVIMQLVAAEVADGNVLDLVERFLKSGVMEDGVFKPTTVGTCTRSRRFRKKNGAGCPTHIPWLLGNGPKAGSQAASGLQAEHVSRQRPSLGPSEPPVSPQTCVLAPLAPSHACGTPSRV